MQTIEEINEEYNLRIKYLINWYHYQQSKIRNSWMPSYYKKYYLRNLNNYYKQLENQYKQIKNQKILKYNTSLNTKANIKALLVGINYYNTDNALRGCINDVDSLKDFFNKNHELNDENIYTLTDDSSIKPTKANILNKFK